MLWIESVIFKRPFPDYRQPRAAIGMARTEDSDHSETTLPLAKESSVSSTGAVQSETQACAQILFSMAQKVREPSSPTASQRTVSVPILNVTRTPVASVRTVQSGGAVRNIEKRHVKKRSRWSEEEKKALRDAVAETGPSWAAVASLMRERSWIRSAKQCRERYMNHERDGLRSGAPWSAAEDAALRALFDTHGPRWATIARARALAGRAPVAVRNRYNWALARRR